MRIISVNEGNWNSHVTEMISLSKLWLRIRSGVCKKIICKNRERKKNNYKCNYWALKSRTFLSLSACQIYITFYSILFSFFELGLLSEREICFYKLVVLTYNFFLDSRWFLNFSGIRGNFIWMLYYFLEWK